MKASTQMGFEHAFTLSFYNSKDFRKTKDSHRLSHYVYKIKKI
jgi:hypothetical protein